MLTNSRLVPETVTPMDLVVLLVKVLFPGKLPLNPFRVVVYALAAGKVSMKVIAR